MLLSSEEANSKKNEAFSRFSLFLKSLGVSELDPETPYLLNMSSDETENGILFIPLPEGTTKIGSKS